MISSSHSDVAEPSQEYPAVEPHIMLSKVWNALAEAAETAPVPSEP